MIWRSVKELKRQHFQSTKLGRHLAYAEHLAQLGSWEWDIAANHVTWSDELYRICGVDPKAFDATYESLLKYIHPDDRERVDKIIKKSLQANEMLTFEYRIVRSDGKVRILYGQGKVNRNKDGKPLRMYSTAQDVTEQRQFEQMKDDFMNIAAHDLRTPSTAVKGFVSMIRKGDFGPPPTGEIGEALKDIEEGADRMITMVNDFLTVSRIEQGHLKIIRQPLDISQFLHDLVRQLEVTIQNPQVVLQLGEIADLPKAFADREKIAQVVTNVIDNALKHTETGTVTVSARMAEKNMIEIIIADTGTGISPEDIPKLFGRYYRGNQVDAVANLRGGGLGLGLYVVKKIIGLHGGTVWAESVLGKGTTMHFTLPIVVEKS